MTDQEIIELAIQGHASTRDAIRWAMQQVRRPPPLFDRDIDAVTVQQWGWDVDFAAHRAYARAIEKAIVGAEMTNNFHPDWDTLKPYQDQHVEDVHLMLDVLKILEEINLGNMTPMAEQSWIKAITALRKRFDLCPDCGEPTRAVHTTYTGIETSYLSCSECDWVGEPE